MQFKSNYITYAINESFTYYHVSTHSKNLHCSLEFAVITSDEITFKKQKFLKIQIIEVKWNLNILQDTA